MKFFAALKTAEFAATAFKAAGLDLDAALAANNPNVLKEALAKNSPEIEALIASAKQENDELSAALATAKTERAAAQSTAAAAESLVQSYTAALDAAGLKLSADAKAADGKIDPAKFKAAHELHVASLVRAECAKAGIKPLDEAATSAAAAVKRTDAKTATLAEWRAMGPLAGSKFILDGGKLTD